MHDTDQAQHRSTEFSFGLREPSMYETIVALVKKMSVDWGIMSLGQITAERVSHHSRKEPS